ncbi:MAG: hypothetical protein V3V45_08810 [Candidatus Brocadiales bacterium]
MNIRISEFKRKKPGKYNPRSTIGTHHPSGAARLRMAYDLEK